MSKNKTVLFSRRLEESDCEAVTALVNSCYRGDSSRAGWTTEADLISGIRIDLDSMRALVNQQDSTLLVFFTSEQDQQEPIGTVLCERDPLDGKGYIGMLTVKPTLQTKGYGKFILATGESYLQKRWNIKTVKMTVIDNREELLAFYYRRGYVNTGQKKKWDFDARFGELLVDKIDFLYLEKTLN